MDITNVTFIFFLMLVWRLVAQTELEHVNYSRCFEELLVVSFIYFIGSWKKREKNIFT